MINRKLIGLAVAGTLAVVAPAALGVTPVQDRSAEVAIVAAADPLLAVEVQRSAIVERLVIEHRATLFANGIAESSFRNALHALRADHLLAASLVQDFAAITTLVNQSPVSGAWSQRFVAVAPTSASALHEEPAAEAYLLRDGDTLRKVKAGELRSVDPGVQLVGYFVSEAGAMIIGRNVPKDGSGSGASSWIGYVAGGNVASASGSAVAAGTFNTASGQNAFVGAGQSNVASGISSLVIGGFDNRATVIDSLVVAGAGNRATGARSVVVGGGYNLASGKWSFIGGGGREVGSGAAGADDDDHIASGDFSTITGGQGNRATDPYTFVGGGTDNTANGSFSTVAGGTGNTTGDSYATIGGGSGNEASGRVSTIGGGAANNATGYGATVVGGFSNTASGDYSVAMGQRAGALANGTFAFADNRDFDFNTITSNSFRVRATGGVRFVVGIDPNNEGATTWSCGLVDGGSWVCSSDRNQKQDIELLDGTAVLDKLVAMPVYAWSPKGKNAHIRHFGPMAQDFHATFGLGDDELGIGQQDVDGVALAAIQGLNSRLAEQARELAEERAARELQAREISELRSHSAAEIAKLKLALEVLLARSQPDAQLAAAH